MRNKRIFINIYNPTKSNRTKEVSIGVTPIQPTENNKEINNKVYETNKNCFATK